MKTDGNLTVFEYIQQSFQLGKLPEQRPAVFIVFFDGEPELWFSKDNNPTQKTIANCILELNQYYQQEWRGTNRLIPVLSGKINESGHINCMQ